MTDYTCVVNPTSGGGAAPRAVVPLARLLRDAGSRVDVCYSTGALDASQTAREAAARGDIIVAVGGDGMLSSIADAVVESGATLGIVPAGRGNDFARQLGIGGGTGELARVLLTGNTRSVDVIDVGVGEETRTVLGSVYAGVDSTASQIVDASQWLPRRLQYPWAAVRSLATYRPARFTVAVDGVAEICEAATVVVANSGYYGSGMHISPDSAVDDGVLDVVVITAARKRDLIRSLPKVYDGSHVALDEVSVRSGREIRVTGEFADGTPVTGYGDGEHLGPLPVTATVRPGALSVLV